MMFFFSTPPPPPVEPPPVIVEVDVPPTLPGDPVVIDEPAEVDTPAVRGDRVQIDPVEEACIGGLTQWGFLPCDQVGLDSGATVTETADRGERVHIGPVTPSSPVPTSLPATGSWTWVFTAIATFFLSCGGALKLITVRR